VALGFAGRDRSVEVWWVDPASVGLAGLERSLEPDEASALSRILAADRRRDFLVGRWLARQMLSLGFPAAPAVWRFRRNSQGRPEIDRPIQARFLSFSLSHTADLVVCAIAARAEIGIDVEDVRYPLPRLSAMAKMYLSPSERRTLARQPSESHAAWFLQRWSLKEAYMKARGLGMSIPARSLSFSVGPAAQIAARFAPGIDDSSAGWHFDQWHLSPHHVISLAARGADRRRLGIRLRGDFGRSVS
jgi:4'-phosphopantetheinyl transferase